MSLHPTGLLKWVTLGDMSQERDTGTGRSNNSLRVTCPLWQKNLVAAIELCLHDRLHKFKLVWICAPGRRDKMKHIFKVASCDLSPRENKNQSVPTYTHQTWDSRLKISSCALSKRPVSATCLPSSAQEAAYRSDPSLRPVAWRVPTLLLEER